MTAGRSINQRGKPCLQRREPEPIAEILDVGTVVPLDQRLDAAPGLPGGLRQAPREKHVVFGLEAFELSFELQQILTDRG